MPIGRKHNKYGVALNKPCSNCGTWERLTRHHVKDMEGIKTGEIVILCRPCHDEVEIQYRREGRIRQPAYDLYTKGRKDRITSIKNVQLDRILPYYAQSGIYHNVSSLNTTSPQ